MSHILGSNSDYAKISHLVKSGTPTAPAYDQAARDKYKNTFVPGAKRAFEAYAFARLFDAKDYLDIASLHKCHSARTDGLFYLHSLPTLPFLLEVKHTLKWSSFNTSLGQFISGKKLLMRKGLIQTATQGLIVFSEFEPGWGSDDPDPRKPWAQLYRHLEEMAEGFQMSALQITPDGFYNPFMEDERVEGRIERLFRPYAPPALVPKAA